MKILLLLSACVIGNLAHTINSDNNDQIQTKQSAEVENTPTEDSDENKYYAYYKECNSEIPIVNDDKSYRNHLICLGNKLKIVDDNGMLHTDELKNGLVGVMAPELAVAAVRQCVVSMRGSRDSPTVELLYCIDKLRRDVPFNPIGRHLEEEPPF